MNTISINTNPEDNNGFRIVMLITLFIVTIMLFCSLCSFNKGPEVFTKASWYGTKYHGKLTANGEKYNQNDLTCASPFIKFNTKLLITNTKNNKSIIVRVNDRGPYNCYKDSITNKIRCYRPLEPHSTRGLDLSRAAFDSIANLDSGIINIKYKILNK